MVQKTPEGDNENPASEMNELEIKIEMPQEMAGVCCDAISIETANEPAQHSKVELKKTSGGLTIKIRSEDLSSMRAAANTYLRWVGLCCELMKNGTNTKTGAGISAGN